MIPDIGVVPFSLFDPDHAFEFGRPAVKEAEVEEFLKGDIGVGAEEDFGEFVADAFLGNDVESVGFLGDCGCQLITRLYTPLP